MRRLLLMITISILVVACTPRAGVYRIKCSGNALKCYNKADKICGDDGYEVLEDERTRHSYKPSVINMKMRVRCKGKVDTAAIAAQEGPARETKAADEEPDREAGPATEKPAAKMEQEDVKTQPGATAPDKSILYDELLKLKELRDLGLLTEAEFDAEKKELLEAY